MYFIIASVSWHRLERVSVESMCKLRLFFRWISWKALARAVPRRLIKTPIVEACTMHNSQRPMNGSIRCHYEARKTSECCCERWNWMTFKLYENREKYLRNGKLCIFFYISSLHFSFYFIFCEWEMGMNMKMVRHLLKDWPAPLVLIMFGLFFSLSFTPINCLVMSMLCTFVSYIHHSTLFSHTSAPRRWLSQASSDCP